jgi:ribosomal protein S18 acetylase RimI-like enzyme
MRPTITVQAIPHATGWARDSLRREWGSTLVARRGELVDAATLPALVAALDRSPVGLATYSTVDGDWEIVSIHTEVHRVGVGSALLTAIENLAETAGGRRVWLVTTNDNTGALRFYQKAGYDLVALHRDAVTVARARLKPEIPTQIDGIELRHELELERLLHRP